MARSDSAQVSASQVDSSLEEQKETSTSKAPAPDTTHDDSSRIFRINMIAYVLLMVVFYGIFIVYAVIPGISSWLATR